MNTYIILLVMLFSASRLYAQMDTTFWERITTLIGPSVDCFSSTEDGTIALSGKTGISALYLSTDGADTWRATSVKGSVKAVYAASPDNLLAVVGEEIFHSADTGKMWRSIPLGWKPVLDRNNFKVSLVKVYSPTPDTVIAFVRITHDRDTNTFTTTVWYTPNLGISWDSVASLPVSFPKIQYSSNFSILFASSTKKLSSGKYSVAVAASWDKGRRWQVLTDSLLKGISSTGVIALNDHSLLAACNSYGLYRSDDTGRTWYKSPTPENAVINCIESNQDGTIFIGSYRYFYTSLDSGKTWSRHSVNNDDVGIYSIHCINRTVVLTTSAGIYRDTAFPSVFTQEYDSILVDNIGSVGLSNTNTIIAAFNGGCAVSNNRGETWHNTTFRDIFPNATCVTNKGALLASGWGVYDSRGGRRTQRSTDNGATWQDVYGIAPNGETYTIYPECFLVAGDTIFAGEAGILRSTDDGQTWRAVQGGGAMCLYRTRAGTYLAGSEGNIVRSTDGGSIFKPAATTLTTLTFITDIAQNPKTGRLFAAETGFCEYGLFYSDDDGATWQPHEWDGCAQKLAVDSIGNVYATSWYGIYRSTDNGATWEEVPSSGLAEDIGDSYGGLFGGSPYGAFLVGSDGRLYLGMRDGGLFRSTQRFPPVSVQEEPEDSAELRIIPNPATESFTVSYPEKTAVTVRDVFGRVALSGAVGESFSTAGLAAGVYFVEVSGADGRRVVGRLAVGR